MAQSKIVSVVDHVQEPPDLWTQRVDEKFKSRVPQVAKQPDGSEAWVIDGAVRADIPLAETGALKDQRFTGEAPRTWAEVPSVLYDPQERLKAMDRDGIGYSVLYPTIARYEVLGTIEDSALQLACVQAYNDWLIDTWGKASPRFIPQAIIPLDPQAAAKELDRAVAKGHRGVIVPIEASQINPSAPNGYDAVWDVLWEKAQTLGVPVCFPSGSAPKFLLDINPNLDAAVVRAFNEVREWIASSGVVPQFLYSGIPERFPKLNVIFASSGVGWCSYSLEVCNHEWDRKYRQITPVLRKDPPYEMELPSDMFHRQMYVTAGNESVGMKVRDFIGIDNILWQSAFPLDLSTYPNSVETIERNMQEVPPDEREKMLSGNAARLYNIKL
jgi:uncharacterized protein